MKNFAKAFLLWIVFLTVMLLSSCEKESTKAFTVAKSDDNNWTTDTRIDCDSVSMLDINTAEIWIDGRKMILKGQIIKIKSN